MSASPTNEAKGPMDNQERRLRLKREAAALAGELAAYGATVTWGKVTASRAVVEVRQDKRARQDVVVTIDDDNPVYTLLGAGDDEEYFDSFAVRRQIIAPPRRSRLWWQLLVVVIAWVLVAIGWAIYQGKAEWLILAGIIVAGTVLTIAAIGVVARIIRAGRRRKMVQKLIGRR